jgi:hypothetical protein
MRKHGLFALLINTEVSAMAEEHFEYMGFIIKVVPIRLASKSRSNRPRFAVIVMVRIPGSADRYYEKWLRPCRICSSSGRALEFGRRFAVRALDEELCCTTFSDLLLSRA